MNMKEDLLQCKSHLGLEWRQLKALQSHGTPTATQKYSHNGITGQNDLNYCLTPAQVRNDFKLKAKPFLGR